VIHDTRVVEQRADGSLGAVIKVVGRHMTGTSIYPPNLRSYTTRHLDDLQQSWDVECRHDLLRHCEHTTLIQHNWATKHYRRTGGRVICDPVHSGISRDEPLREDAVVLHGCKDDSLCELIHGTRV
jgi:hypothetical protein